MQNKADQYALAYRSNVLSGNPRMIRPLVLISGLAPGGAERVTVSFVCRMAAKGVKAIVCTVTDECDGPLAGELLNAGVIRHNLFAKRPYNIISMFRLLRLIRKYRIDIVHAHGPEASTIATAARCFTHVPLVITRHVLDELRLNKRQRLRSWLTLIAAKRADAVIAVSSAVAKHLSQTAEIPIDLIRVIYNGIELDKFQRSEFPERRTEIRESIGLKPNNQFVLIPAVLRKGKGHDILIKTLPHILRIHPSLRLVFAGSGGEELAIRKLAKPYKDSVIFLGHREDIPELLSACDLVVLPSLAEALPTALIEAAAAGRPIVATRVGGTEEIIEHGSTGFLVPPNDSILLAEHVIKLLSDPALARKFGEEASSLSHKRFSIDLQIKQTLELWKEVIGGANQ